MEGGLCMDGYVGTACISALSKAKRRVESLSREESGQGTTEYAILVGVLVVIAILSIVTFRGKVQELWSAIADGMGQL